MKISEQISDEMVLISFVFSEIGKFSSGNLDGSPTTTRYDTGTNDFGQILP